MKKIVLFAFTSAALALVLSGCSSSGGSDSTKGATVTDQTVTQVAAYTPANLTVSGAPAAWKEADIADATNTIVDDPLVSSAMSTFTGLYGSSENARATVTNLQEAIDDMTASIKDLPKTKSLNKSYDLSDKVLNDNFFATSLKSTMETTIVTTDGAALDADEMSNFLSGTGKVTLNADINAITTKIPVTSSIKDAKIKINLTAVASVGSYEDEYGDREVKDLSFSYAASMSFGASYNNGTVGGKLIITVTAAKPVTVIENTEETDESAALKPSTVTIDITAYNDAGTVILTKHFTTFDEFTAYINQ